MFLHDMARAAVGNTYYVAPNGNDNNVGSQAAPLKTIQKAVDKTQPGDTVYVRGGTYHEDIRFSNSGTAQKPIRLLAYPGELPIIDGQYNLPGGEAVTCSNVAPFHCFVYTPLVLINGQHLEFSGFKIIRSRGRGIGVTSPSNGTSGHILIDSCIIDGTRNALINIQDTEDVTIQNCDVSHGADFATHNRSSSVLNWPVIVNIIRSNNVTVRRNKIYESWGEGIAAGRDATNVTIEDNIIYDNFALQVYLHRSQDVLLQRNLIYHTNAEDFRRGGNPSECIVVNNESNFMDSLLTARLKIINNVVTGCGRGIAIWGNAGTDVLTKEIEISHNTVVNSVKNNQDDPVGIFVNSRATLRNILIEKNLVLQEDGLVASIPVHSEIELASNFWSSTPSEGAESTTDYVGDPQLTSPNRALVPGAVQIDWFKPKNSSPALALGMGPYEYLDQAALDDPSLATPVPTENPTISPTPGPTPEPTPEPAPVPDTGSGTVELSNPLLLYQFDEGQGAAVRNRSNQNGVDLTIENSGAVQWTEDGLSINQPVMIRSTTPATNLVNACKATNELSLSLWITPANTTQDGPARIISLSSDATNRNFMLGQGMWGNQPTDLFTARLRTTETDSNGEPSMQSSVGAAKPRKTHLVYTRSSNGATNLYVDGVSVASGTLSGTFSNWDDSYALLLANESSGDRPWLGTYHQIAIYCGALTKGDVEDLYSLSANLPGFSPEDTDFLPGIFLPFVSQ